MVFNPTSSFHSQPQPPLSQCLIFLYRRTGWLWFLEVSSSYMANEKLFTIADWLSGADSRATSTILIDRGAHWSIYPGRHLVTFFFKRKLCGENRKWSGFLPYLVTVIYVFCPPDGPHTPVGAPLIDHHNDMCCCKTLSGSFQNPVSPKWD